MRQSPRPRRPERLHDRCTHEILNAVRSGNLKPGQRLSEGPLATKLGVGRATVRVALNQLAWAGLLYRVSRSGTYLRKISLIDYDEVIELRGELEAMAAARACLRMQTEELKELYRIGDRLDYLGDEADRHRQWPRVLDKDYTELESLESRFHRGIIRASGTKHILPILDNFHLLDRSFLIGMSFPEGNVSKVRRVPRHTEIAAAMQRRNPELVKKVVRRHYRLLRDNLILRFGPSVLINGKNGHSPVRKR